MIAEDRIETVGTGIDAVTDHVIVTVVTVYKVSNNIKKSAKITLFNFILLISKPILL